MSVAFRWRQTVTGGVWIPGSIKAHPSLRGGKTVSLVRAQNPSLNASVTCHQVTHCTVTVGLLPFTSELYLLKQCSASSYEQSPLPSLFPIDSRWRGDLGVSGQEKAARADQKSHYLVDFRMPAFHLFCVLLKQVLELQSIQKWWAVKNCKNLVIYFVQPKMSFLSGRSFF